MTTYEEIKKDYTYVALLDTEASKTIKEFQRKFDKVFGTSGNVCRWPPHTTISISNLLSSKDLEDVKSDCNCIAKLQKTFDIKFEKMSITKEVAQKSTTYYITLKIKKNRYLEALSQKVMKVAQKHEVPYDKFTEYKFHVTLGKYAASKLNEKELQKIIGNKNTIPKATISSFSIFYATINNPKLKSAIEVERFNFK